MTVGAGYLPAARPQHLGAKDLRERVRARVRRWRLGIGASGLESPGVLSLRWSVKDRVHDVPAVRLVGDVGAPEHSPSCGEPSGGLFVEGGPVRVLQVKHLGDFDCIVPEPRGVRAASAVVSSAIGEVHREGAYPAQVAAGAAIVAGGTLGQRDQPIALRSPKGAQP